MKTGSFDFSFLQKLMDPKSTGDLNLFLENLPKHAGQSVLIAAGIIWAVAAGLGVFTSVQTQKLIELQGKLGEVQALKPSVPTIKDVPLKQNEVKVFAEKMATLYRGLDIRSKGSVIMIVARDTARYTEFREAVGHVQNGGSGWRVSLEKLCVGRECPQGAKLAASLKINRVSVEQPK